MSSSKPAVAAAISPAVRELLEKVVQEGSMSDLMQALRQPAEHLDEFELIPGGVSMTDASKRRHTESPEDHDQMPVLRFKAKEDLPHGVHSFEEWGKTLIVSGKYVKREMSYRELAESIDPEKRSYCTWLRSQNSRKDLTAPIKDLVLYLVAYEKKHAKGSSCYPGSSIVRLFKE